MVNRDWGMINTNHAALAVLIPGYREFFIDTFLVRIYLIIEMIWWTGLAPWEFDFFLGSLISSFPSAKSTSPLEYAYCDPINTNHAALAVLFPGYRGTSLVRNTHPPRITMCP